MGEQPTDESNLSSPSDRRGSNSGDRARTRNNDTFASEKVDWHRPALLRGDGKGNEPLGDSPWDVWRWLAPLTFVFFALITSVWAVDHVEDVIEETAAEVLLNAGIPSGTLGFDASYRSLEVSGTVPDGVTAAEIESTLLSAESATFSLRNVTVDAATPAVQGPVSLSVELVSSGEVITLTGTVPTQQHKDALLDAAGRTGLTIEEFLTVTGSDALSPDPDGQISSLATVVELLEVGTFTEAIIGVGDVGPVTGAILAADSSAADQFETVVPDAINVSAPDALGFLEVDVNYDGQRIVLDGTVLSIAQSLELGFSAVEVVGAENVVNNLIVSNLNPAEEGVDDRVGALAASIATFDGLMTATATLDDSDLTVNGFAFDEESQSAANAAIDSAESVGLRPGGVISLLEIADLPVQEQINLLQAELDGLEEEIRETVLFEPNVSTLTPAATATLDKVVDAMNRHPLPVVEVGGHTDDLGPEEVNQALSQARADAVAAYIGQSIEPGRLSAIGFGESQPIADSTTEEGLAQNRRVELIARESF